MSLPALGNEVLPRQEPHLRLVVREAGTITQPTPHLPEPTEPAAPEAPSQAAHVLVVGAQESIRSNVLEELCELLPPGTRFVQAAETWEAIARASTSIMVVIAGDLGDVSTKSFLRLLGRRYPALPVLALGERAPGRAAADADVAGT